MPGFTTHAAKAAATDNYYPEPGEQGFRRNPGLAPRDGEPIVAENTGWSFTTGGDNPYGELPPVVHHPLPAHLKAKLDHALMTANTKTIGELADIVMGEEVPVDPASFPSCQLIREGNDLRFPTAKELWRDGGRDSFNAEVTRWSEERNGSGDAVRVGGSPTDGADDPFDFGF